MNRKIFNRTEPNRAESGALEKFEPVRPVYLRVSGFRLAGLRCDLGQSDKTLHIFVCRGRIRVIYRAQRLVLLVRQRGSRHGRGVHRLLLLQQLLLLGRGNADVLTAQVVHENHITLDLPRQLPVKLHQVLALVSWMDRRLISGC